MGPRKGVTKKGHNGGGEEPNGKRYKVLEGRATHPYSGIVTKKMKTTKRKGKKVGGKEGGGTKSKKGVHTENQDNTQVGTKTKNTKGKKREGGTEGTWGKNRGRPKKKD